MDRSTQYPDTYQGVTTQQQFPSLTSSPTCCSAGSLACPCGSVPPVSRHSTPWSLGELVYSSALVIDDVFGVLHPKLSSYMSYTSYNISSSTESKADIETPLPHASSLDTGTIGPVTTMHSFIQTFGHFSAMVHGVVVSSILITGVLAALVVGNLADRFGRTRIIVVGSAIFGLGSAIETCSFHLPVFILGRLIKGAGEGCFLSTVYVLTAELSPAKQRGAVTNLAGIAITTGIVLGFFMCYGTARLYADEETTAGEGLRSLQWRLPIAVQSFIAFSNALLTGLLVPQSPRWLLATGKAEEARQFIAKLGLSDEEAAELLEPSQPSSSSDEGTTTMLAHSPSLTLWQSIKQTLHDFRTALSPPVRNRTLFGCFIMASQQLAGIDGVLYYAPLLFAQAGMGSEQATFLASGVSGLVILAATIPSTLLCDMWGRKTAAITGGFGLTTTMVLIGALYAAYPRAEEMPQAAKWTVVVMIYLYAVVFTSTWALVFRMYMIESLPRRSRSSGSALAQASNWVSLFFSLFLSSSFPTTSP